MVYFTHDSEILSHYVAAVPIPNSSHFVAVRDEHHVPLIFSLGNNGILYAIKEASNGSRKMIDLNKALGLTDLDVVTFEAVQDAEDVIYMCFAANYGKYTPLTVLRPFRPEDLNSEGEYLDLTRLKIIGKNATEIKVSKIFMGEKDSRREYPQITLGFVPLKDVHTSEDLASVQFASGLDWTLSSNVDLPENATQIVDFTPALLPIGPGYFALYVIQGQTQLIFSTIAPPGGHTYQATLQCPQGARCLSTIKDAAGYTSLLVGGQGIWCWTAQDAQRKQTQGTLISNPGDGGLDGVIQLHVAQADNAISIFATDSEETVSYAITPDLNFGTQLASIPLVSEGEGGTFAPFFPPDGLTQQVIVANSTGQLTLLQHDISADIWIRTPFYTPNLTENIEYNAYMTRITIRDDNGKPMPDAPLIVKSPEGWVDVIVNGRNVTLGPYGTMTSSDLRGTLTIIAPSEDISSWPFRVSTIGNADKGLVGEEVEIDPTEKTISKLKKIQNGDDLREARLEDGTRVLEGSDASDADIDTVADAIRQLVDLAPQVKKRSLRPVVRNVSHNPLAFKLGRVRSGKDLGRCIAGWNSNRIMASKNIIDSAWAGFRYYFLSPLESLFAAYIELAADGVHLILDFGKRVFRLLIDSIGKLAKAISMLMEKLAKGWDKFLEWLKMVLGWQDIVDTARSIRSLMNNALDYGDEGLNHFADQIEARFDDFKENLRGIEVAPEVTGTTGGGSSSDEPPENVTSEDTQFEDSVAGGYTEYQLTHGGGAEHSLISSNVGGDPVATMNNIFVDLTGSLGEVADSFKETKDSLQEMFVEMAKKGEGVELGEVLQTIGIEILIGILDGLKAITIGFLRLAGEIIRGIKAIANADVQIPVFSAWYKRFTGKSLTFTILEAVSFIIAIPYTLQYKKATGSKPPAIDIPFPELFGTSSSKTATHLKQSLKDGAMKRPLEDDNPVLGINKRTNFAFARLDVSMRWLGLIFGSMLFFVEGSKDKRSLSSARSTEMDPRPSGLRSAAFQQRKFQAPHPLKSLDLGTSFSEALPYLTNVFSGIDLLVSAPYPSTASPDPAGMRRLRWTAHTFGIIGWLLGFAPQNPVMSVVKAVPPTITLILISFVHNMEHEARRDGDDSITAHSTRMRIGMSVLDLLTSWCQLAASEARDAKQPHLTTAFFAVGRVCELSSCSMLTRLTKESIKKEKWNYLMPSPCR
ncbi:hypothetical protein M501DRAFT_1016569 [Patellaria atrata CBS 101060]|uniref:Uncharacterized protein n=1 Tax=Patellaria atrata CBS 101060 TaxID=1346257 RepID=A0A9P4VSE4_9PEZI|nr:hypothetical protein M501DRAFT_1016569 [Patellaria atrata CBS 101060]